jgi:NADH kinase
VDVSIDGVGRQGIGVGMGVRVWGESVGRERDIMAREGGTKAEGEGNGWIGGVPCVMRGQGREGASGDDGWVGGLNGLLKFNYPFGEES